jgi:hypothetical protein
MKAHLRKYDNPTFLFSRNFVSNLSVGQVSMKSVAEEIRTIYVL